MQETTTTLQMHETVRQDALGYRSQVERFQQGQMPPVAFKAYRVPMGVYEQRKGGQYMIRIRLGAGLIRPVELDLMAQLSQRYGNGSLHVTTRQDIQIHDVRLEDTASVMEALLEVGLSSRGGGGNTVRNVGVSPYAGVSPDELFDVTPHVIALTEYLLQERSSFALPRKYKIAFSGSSKDDAFASATDLGFFAKVQDGAKGFEVFAAGGMGSSPRVGIQIESFVPETEIFVVAEAIKQVFETHGDRSNKNKARLRYVLARLGREAFIQTYQERKRAVLNNGLRGDIPQLRQIITAPVPLEVTNDLPQTRLDLRPEKTAGYHTVRLALPLGDVPAEDAVRISDMAKSLDLQYLRATQSQDLLILSVPQTKLSQVDATMKELSVSLQNDLPPIVACAGASTCKLGLCRSRGLASAIADALKWKVWDRAESLPVIRISGCPNACAQHQVADIGFQGRARRVNGRLMPYYDVFAGARLEQGHTELGHRIGSLPAKRVPAFMEAVARQGHDTVETLSQCIQEFATLDDPSVPEDYYVDYDAKEPFSLAGRGAGECSAGVMDIVKADIAQASEALGQKAVDLDTLSRATLAAARALLVLFGVEARTDQDIADGFNTHLVRAGWVAPETYQLVLQAASGDPGDPLSRGEVKALVDRIAALHESLDGQLKFQLAPVAAPAETAEPTASDCVDLRGVSCPLNFVKAKLALEQVEIGATVEYWLDRGEALDNVPESFKQQGQEILLINPLEDYVSLKVKRLK